MLRSDMEILFYDLFREKSSNTAISTTVIDRWLDLAYKAMVADIMPEWLSASETITVPQTTLATRASATSFTVASATSFSQLTDIAMWTSGRYDTARLTTISSVTFTLASPGVPYVHTTASKITPVSFIITEGREIIDVQWHVLSTTENTITNMDRITEDDMTRLGHQPQSTGVPAKWALMLPTEMRVYPIPDEAGYLRIRYKNKTEYSLASAASEPLLEEDAQIGMVFFALWMALLRDKNFKEAEIYKNEYYSTVNRAIMMKHYKNQSANKYTTPLETL